MVWRRPVLSAVLGTVAGILILASGCTDFAPTAVRLDPVSVSAKSSLLGTQARVVQSSIRAENRVFNALIDREGGTLDFGIGRISFPKGAVARPTQITARVDGSGIAVTFGPHGLTFAEAHEPTIEFSYKGLDVDPTSLKILYVDTNGKVREVLSTEVDPAESTARAKSGHFSKYVLAVG